MRQGKEDAPMMTMHEQWDRAQARAFGMRTWVLADGRTFLVRSRSQDGFYKATRFKR